MSSTVHLKWMRHKKKVVDEKHRQVREKYNRLETNMQLYMAILALSYITR